MHWGKQRHNRKHMSKRYHMTHAHYQADSAPLRDAKKRKEGLIAALKNTERQRQIADKAANVAEQIGNEAAARKNANQKSHHQEGI